MHQLCLSVPGPEYQVSGWLDGAANHAVFNYPGAVAVDNASNVYVADGSNNVIRMIDTNGTVTTIAGIPGVVGGRDGIGTNALFNNPCGIAVDPTTTIPGGQTNLFVADTVNSTIRRVYWVPGRLVGADHRRFGDQLFVSRWPGPGCAF